MQAAGSEETGLFIHLFLRKSITVFFDDSENVLCVGVVDAACEVVHLVGAGMVFSFDEKHCHFISVDLLSIFFYDFFARFADEEVGCAAAIERFEE